MTASHSTDKLFKQIEQQDFIKRVDFEKQINDPFDTLDIDIIGGNLILLAGTESNASLRMQWNQNDPQTMPSFHLKDQTIQIKEPKKITTYLRQRNAFVIELKVPAKTNLNIKMLAGTILIDGISGNIQATLKAGSIEGNSPTHQANIKVGAGNIKLHHVLGSITARVKMGDVEISSDDISKNDKLELSSFMGDVKLKLPQGLLQSAPQTTKGEIENTVGAYIKTTVIIGDIFCW